MVNRERQIDKRDRFPLCNSVVLCVSVVNLFHGSFTTETQRTTEDAQRGYPSDSQSFSQSELQPIHFAVISLMIIARQMQQPVQDQLRYFIFKTEPVLFRLTCCLLS